MVAARNRKLGAGRWAVITLCVAVQLLLIGCADPSTTASDGYGVGWMMPSAWGWVGAMLPLMFLGMVVFWVAITRGLVGLVRWIVSLYGSRTTESVDAPDLARRRYARGEIRREDFERIRDRLSRAA